VILDPWTHACCQNDDDCVSTRCVDSICMEPTCNDGFQNGLEVDIDCGGGCLCNEGQACISNSQCKSNACVNQICSMQICSKNVPRSRGGWDCWDHPTCPLNHCADFEPCDNDDDCESQHCFTQTNYTCAAPTCDDARRNGKETDRDCGGATECLRCEPGRNCTMKTDCDSKVCTNGACAPPTCEDNEKNGNETDIDCGGGDCPLCNANMLCLLNIDCEGYSNRTMYCNAFTKKCTTIPPSCSDGFKNGVETDVDCGGSCPQCLELQGCVVNSDCISRVCGDSKKCSPPNCFDNELNGNETDVDCGGDCEPCRVQQKCLDANDCVSGVCSRTCTSGVCSTLFCKPSTCVDHVKNGNETDVDCGGHSCGMCQISQTCLEHEDCQSKNCLQSTCMPPDCNNKVIDGVETDVDCGGVLCVPCHTGKSCRDDLDCSSNVCLNSICAPALCNDAKRNGNETDVDCGGGECLVCRDSSACIRNEDCASLVCSSGTCVQPTCIDGRKNGAETDVDCGGPCDPCEQLQTCTSHNDCKDRNCLGFICQPPTCFDGIRNGNESDVDCGLSCPLQCLVGQDCSSSEDCASTVCSGLLCVGSTCSDSKKNGDETDVDCGGSQCQPCPFDGLCASSSDCNSKVCNPSTRKCERESCDDGVKNGDETDVDCGADCLPCLDHRLCLLNSDCSSSKCIDRTCRCGDGFINGDETYIDCGGMHCEYACADSLPCLRDVDCLNRICGGDFTCSVPKCDDNVKNGVETDVDCGGVLCVPCHTGKSCRDDLDCSSNVCLNSICAPALCNDAKRNGNETDVDCGGGECLVCRDSSACIRNEDCASLVCSSGTCVQPTCIDGRKNGAETDVDCGGPCDPCEQLQTCTSHNDCKDRNCLGFICQPPTCFDGIRNGNESDVDCGLSCPLQCLVGQDCSSSEDCASTVCSGLLCVGSTCSDSKKNGDETDVDCGGSQCQPCPFDGLCASSSDCNSKVCNPSTRKCERESCDDGVKNGDETDVDCGGLSPPSPPCMRSAQLSSTRNISNDLDFDIIIANLDMTPHLCSNITCIVQVTLHPSESVHMLVVNETTSFNSVSMIVSMKDIVTECLHNTRSMDVNVKQGDDSDGCTFVSNSVRIVVDTIPPNITWRVQSNTTNEYVLLLQFSERVISNLDQLILHNCNVHLLQWLNDTSLQLLVSSIGVVPSITLSPNFYSDMAGNVGQIITIPFGFESYTITRGLTALATTSVATVVTTSIISTAAFLVSTGASGTQSFLAKSNLLRAGYHVQIMSMSTNLAIPNLSGT
jgi:hypothetical protein